MGLETGNFVDDLNIANPTGADPKSQGDDQLRLIKTTLVQSLVGFPGAIIATGTDGGAVNAYTLTPAPYTLIAYGNRMMAVFAPTVTNTLASTINISALGAKAILRVDGSPLQPGDLVFGTIYAAFYNGTAFQLLSATKGYLDTSFAAKINKAGDTYTGIHDLSGATEVKVPTPVNAQDAVTLAYAQGLAYASVLLPILQGETLTADGQVLSALPAYRSEYATAASGSLFVLPDARTQKLGFAYEFYATAADTLMANDGTYLGSTSIPAGLSRLWCLDNTTQAGTWAITPAVTLTTLAQAILASNVATISASLTAANTHTKTITLDATRSLILYGTAGASAAASGLYCVTATCGYTPLGRPTINLSAPVLISGGANVGVGGGTTSNSPGCVFSACLIGPDLVAVSWHEYNAGSVTPRCAAISTSGANPAPGAVVSLHAAYAGGLSGTLQGTCVCSPAAGAFVVAYQDFNGTCTVFSRYCTVTGNTISPGSEVTVQALSGAAGSLSGNVLCVAHSATLVSYVTYFNPGTTNKTCITAATITAGSLSPGSPVQYATATSVPVDMASLGASAGVVALNNATGGLFSYTISGNTPTLGAGVTVAAAPQSIGAVSATQVFVFTSSSTASNIAVSGTSTVVGSPATITGLSSNFGTNTVPGNATLSGTAMISGADVITMSTATRRGASGASAAAAQASITGSGRYSLQVTSNGSSAVTARAYLPTVPLS